LISPAAVVKGEIVAYAFGAPVPVAPVFFSARNSSTVAYFLPKRVSAVICSCCANRSASAIASVLPLDPDTFTLYPASFHFWANNLRSASDIA
jgi:hypothetical protein